MKKLTTIFMLFMAVAMITSCGKEEKETEKERVLKLLTSGNWYYVNFENNKTGYEQDCFDNTDYWEFEANGNLEDSWDFGNGTYTISEDGKTITATIGDGTFTISNITITETDFSFNMSNSTYYFDYTLSKTAGSCS